MYWRRTALDTKGVGVSEVGKVLCRVLNKGATGSVLHFGETGLLCCRSLRAEHSGSKKSNLGGCYNDLGQITWCFRTGW